MNPMFYVLALVAAVLTFEGVHEMMSERRTRGQDSARKRLRQMSKRLQAPSAIDEDTLLRIKATGVSLVERLLAYIPGRQELELRIYRAGLSTRPEVFLALSGGLAVAGAFFGLTFFYDPGMALLLACSGVLPWFQLSRLQARRLAKFEQQFPDALDLLIRALRAGHSLVSGFVMVGKELPDPIGGEFSQVADEVQLGQTLRNALANLCYRVNSPDLPFFVTAVSIQQETGSNLAEVLENLASVMRERFKLFGKVRALTAMGRASANLLATWPVVMVVSLYMVNREYIAPLWEEPLGHTLLIISIVMVAVGYVLCRKMATIRV
jgi:tight adherence protein B